MDLQVPDENTEDWCALRDLVLGSALRVPDGEAQRALPRHLHGHPITQLISRFVATGDQRLLEQAGRALAGVENWYVALGKS